MVTEAVICKHPECNNCHCPYLDRRRKCNSHNFTLNPWMLSSYSLVTSGANIELICTSILIMLFMCAMHISFYLVCKS
jgi:hypothetical protein